MSRKPKIVGHTPNPVREAQPPKCSMPHPWGVEECRPRKGDVQALYLDSKAEEALRKHALAHVDERLEVMGLLLGEMRVHGGKAYAVASSAVTTELEATQVGVKFSRGGLDGLAAELAKTKPDYVIVGWYHSHPGFGCFLSETDVATQKAMFSGEAHVALVVDPVKEQAGAFKLDGKGYAPVPFCVYLE